MISLQKSWFRDFLPAKIQVLLKFWLNRARGRLEREVQLLRWLVKPGDRVLDIGGNRGVYAYSLWRLGARVEVFEPNPVCADVLGKWAKGKDRVRVHDIALSDNLGKAELHIPIDTSGVEHDASASLEHDDFSCARNVQVKLRTLDSFDFAEVVFIKVDVEGHESKVLYGAEQTIKFSSPALLIEIEQRHNRSDIEDIFDLLASWGYQGFYLDQGKLHNLIEFVLARDQAASNFGVVGSRYINNFLFLHQSRLDSGEYKDLFQSWGHE